MLVPLYSLYLRICLFQAGPETTPHSRVVFGASLGGAVFVAWLSALTLDSGAVTDGGFRFGLVRCLLIGGVLWLLLGLFGRTARWLQVTSAVYGCGALLNGLALPFVWLLPSDPGALQSLLWMLVFGFGLWQFVIIVRILRAAMESGFGLAVGMAILLEIAPLPLLYGLFPELIGPVSING